MRDMINFSTPERRLGVLCSVLLWLTACAAPATSATPADVVQPKVVTVFAAASLLEPFGEIGEAFRAATPDIEVLYNFDGSQTLRAQMEQGAIADVFASANVIEMDKAIAAGLVAAQAPQTFAHNKLVVIVPAINPVVVQSLSDLANPGLFLALAADDVPAGIYSRQVLKNLEAGFGADFSEAVLANVVTEENNVKQVAAKVQLGEVDAGMVYATDAHSPELVVIDIPEPYNVIAEYRLAATTRAPQPAAANAFVDFVLSATGQAILQKYGFTTPAP